MKRITIILLGALLGLNACDDFLNKGPLTTLSESSYWQSGTDAEYAVNGLYEAFYEFDGGGAFSPGGAPYLDLCTDLMYLKAPWEFGFNDFCTGTLTADNSWVSSFWNTKYRIIRNCNFFFRIVEYMPYRHLPYSLNLMTPVTGVTAVTAYPQLYRTCHTRHCRHSCHRRHWPAPHSVGTVAVCCWSA